MAHDHARPEDAPEVIEAGGEVGHFDDATAGIVETRHQNGGIAAVVLLGADEIVQLDVEHATPLIRLAVEQPAEDRIAVEAGQAAPHDAASRVDERSEAAVADDSKIERAHQDSPAA